MVYLWIAILLYTPVLCRTPIALPILAAYGGVLTRCTILLCGFYRKMYHNISKDMVVYFSLLSYIPCDVYNSYVYTWRSKTDSSLCVYYGIPPSMGINLAIIKWENEAVGSCLLCGDVCISGPGVSVYMLHYIHFSPIGATSAVWIVWFLVLRPDWVCGEYSPSSLLSCSPSSFRESVGHWSTL